MKTDPCVCDRLFGARYGSCESSTAFLCDLASAAPREPRFRVDGQPCDLDRAVNVARQILADSRYALIAGLDVLGIASQQLAVKIAAAANAVVDSTFSPLRDGSVMSLCREGTVTATVGELLDRSDLVLAVDCDPELTHPRISQLVFERPSKGPVVVLGDPHTMTASRANRTVPLRKDQIESALMVLESNIRKMVIQPDGRSLSAETLTSLDELAGELLDCQYVGILANHLAPTNEVAFASVHDSLISLVKSLNREVRAVSLGLRNDRNAIAAENVLAWSTGFPHSVDLTNHPPRSFQTECAADQVLCRQECDAAMLFQYRQQDTGLLERSTQDFLTSIPRIVITHAADDAALPLNADGGRPLLEISNLTILPDDFARCDDLLVTVASQTPLNASNQPDLRSFLNQLLQGLD